MRLSTFTAPSFTEAMAQARAALGADAAIVETERDARGRARIVATADIAEPAPRAVPEPLAVESAAQPDDPLPLLLAFHGVPPALVSRLQEAARNDYDGAAFDENLELRLARGLAATLHFAPLPALRTGHPLLLVGPPGAGKTALAAKLAHDAKCRGRDVRLTTLDCWRVNAAEQLAAYAQRIDVPVDLAADDEALAAQCAIAAKLDAALIIDTPGINPWVAEERNAATQWLLAARGDAVLVLSAGIMAEEAVEHARAFAAIGCMRVVMTRLDVARRFGGALAASEAAMLALSAATASPRVVDGIESLDPTGLARALHAGFARRKR
jgi:flagellar biosynthesis protein FlhF